jgi:hypothetical protein
MGRDRGQSKHWRRPRDFSPGLPHKGDYGDRFPAWDAIDLARKCSGRAAYPGWTFAVTNTGPLGLEAFRSDPADPKSLQKLGPWPIPTDADEDRIHGIILDAVASVDGEGARNRVRWR